MATNNYLKVYVPCLRRLRVFCFDDRDLAKRRWAWLRASEAMARAPRDAQLSIWQAGAGKPIPDDVRQVGETPRGASNGSKGASNDSKEEAAA